MTDKDNVPLDHIPLIIPARDEVVSRRAAARGKRQRGTAPGGGGAGLLARLFIVLALLIAAMAWAWAFRLQQALAVTDRLLTQYESRIGDLEDRLSDTDEGMSQSAATVAVKIKELTSEVDKLWASAWRQHKASIQALKKTGSSQGDQLATLSTAARDHSTQLNALTSDIKGLRSVAGELQRLLANTQSNQALLERLGDEINRTTLDLARINKRLQTSEEWQRSVDGFRKQVNQSLIRLQHPLP